MSAKKMTKAQLLEIVREQEEKIEALEAAAAAAKSAERRTNGLGHTLGSQAHMLDDLLREGNSIAVMAGLVETTKNRVRSHMNHLIHKKGCTIASWRLPNSKSKVYQLYLPE